MSSTYAVTVEIWAESAEEAVRRTIIPGSVQQAEVQDLGNQIQSPPTVKVAAAIDDDVLPL